MLLCAVLFRAEFLIYHELKEMYLLSVEENAGLGFDMAQDFLWEMRCSRSHGFSDR